MDRIIRADGRAAVAAMREADASDSEILGLVLEELAHVRRHLGVKDAGYHLTKRYTTIMVGAPRPGELYRRTLCPLDEAERRYQLPEGKLLRLFDGRHELPLDSEGVTIQGQVLTLAYPPISDVIAELIP